MVQNSQHLPVRSYMSYKHWKEVNLSNFVGIEIFRFWLKTMDGISISFGVCS